MNNALLNNIATEIVADKVMKDKMEEFQKKQDQEEVVEQQNKKKLNNHEEDQDDDDIFKEDEDEARFMSELKEKKLAEIGLKPKLARDRSKEKKKVSYRYGEYREIEESEFLDTLLKNEKVVCHFYHPEFEKCKVMDKHLTKVAFDHSETLFVKINADKSPFFTTKLQIQVLPTVLLSNNGKVFDRIIGFEGLEGIEDFPTINLVRKLVLTKMIKPKNKNEKGEMKIKKKTKLNQGESDDSDEDYC